MSGKIFLVRAGPGKPELIAVQALRVIQTTDVILHDRLIVRELLDEAPSHAEIIDVDKKPTTDKTCLC